MRVSSICPGIPPPPAMEGPYGPWPQAFLLMKAPCGCWLMRVPPSARLPLSPALHPLLVLVGRRGDDALLAEGCSWPQHPFTGTPHSSALEPEGFPDLSSVYLTLTAVWGGWC